jgi:predicted  nucleic acid-binding Zn-ribbon protein
MPDSQNGWNEYSKLVLKELESLTDSIDNLKIQVEEVKKEVIEIKVREDRIDELKTWKERMDEVSSPTQLKELTSKVEDLGNFKTKAIGIFITVQFFMGAILWYLRVF